MKLRIAFSTLFLFLLAQSAFTQQLTDKYIYTGLRSEVHVYPTSGPFVGVSIPLSERQVIRDTFSVTTAQYLDHQKDLNITNEFEYNFLLDARFAAVVGVRAARKTEIGHISRQFLQAEFGLRGTIPGTPKDWTWDIQAVQSTPHHGQAFNKFSTEIRKRFCEKNIGLFIPAEWERTRIRRRAHTDLAGRRHPGNKSTENEFSIGIGFWWGFGEKTN